jgi:Uncharacterized protein predicted to be involved in DNA repair (RAMP superfamily)
LDEKNLMLCIFDNKEQQSVYNRDIFFDAVPVRSFNQGNKFLDSDYLAPHKEPLKNLIPLLFLKVLPQVEYRFEFQLTNNGIDAKHKLLLFRQIILDLGLGAKTNVGYGQFDESVEEKHKQQEMELQIRRENSKREKEIMAKKEADLYAKKQQKIKEEQELKQRELEDRQKQNRQHKAEKVAQTIEEGLPNLDSNIDFETTKNIIDNLFKARGEKTFSVDNEVQKIEDYINEYTVANKVSWKKFNKGIGYSINKWLGMSKTKELFDLYKTRKK